MGNAHFGMIGLGTMGRNFLLNAADSGIAGVGTDLEAPKRELLLEEGQGLPVLVGNDLNDFLAKLEKPRNIMMLVPAGPIVDNVIRDLSPHLEPGDLVIDGGNSHFNDTERREAGLAAMNIGFMGIGVSGGETGARHGASLMPGGTRENYARVEEMLTAVAAKVNGEPCVAYMGRGSAGHFVKMVHNGIEYGMMQLLAETYDLMQRVLRMANTEMQRTFAEWNGGELNSYLVEITSVILQRTDADTGNPLVSMVLDTAGQKGTGKWTSQTAMDHGVPVPTIDSAVAMRQISAQKAARTQVAAEYDEMSASSDQSRGRTSAGELEDALLCAFILTYCQGMSLLQAASEEKDYGLDLAEIARIWRGGCIIRSKLLETIRQAYAADPSLASLLLDKRIAEMLHSRVSALRKVVVAFNENGIPAMSFSSALNYFDSFRTARLPANLIQAQRDYFGAHTYQRTDKEGTFHTPDW